MSYYKVEQIAEKLNITVSAARNRIFKNNIKKVKTKNGRAYYTSGALELLGQNNIKYYPIETTVTYYIYQSKINYEKHTR